ncbi:hypothetical protein B0H14DRAFT_2339263, partial [Mycena olivaceomarginata]
LLPKLFRECIIFEQAAAVEAVGFHPAFLAGKSRPLLNDSQPPQPSLDQVSLNKAVAELSAKLDVYEAILETYQFLAGDEFTLADLCH